MEKERYYEDMEDKEVFEGEKDNEKEELYPNCSEIVWRLEVGKSQKEKIIDALGNEEDEGGYETGTDNFPNGCLDNMIMIFEEAKEIGKDINEVELKLIENNGGGGNWDFVEDCLEIAKACIQGKITQIQSKKLEEESWDSDDDFDVLSKIEELKNE